MDKNIPEELELLNEWQTRLGLKDWFIMLETNCKPDKMDIKDADGCVSYTETTKAGRIQIVDSKLREGSICPFNFEETLVHELLHMKLCLLEQGTDWDNELQLRLLHQVINDLSRALVSAKYYKKDKANE